MSTIPITGADIAAKRETFFRVVFQNVSSGYVSIARRVAGKGIFDERFYKWPDELSGLSHYIEQSVMTHDLWFCPMLFDRPERKKVYVEACPTIWADLDTCPPESLLVSPSILVQTSSERYQAVWILSAPADPLEAQDTAKRVAYYHAQEGADTSGWDLTQLLRIPYTLNHKYRPPSVVAITKADDNVPLNTFAVYPEVAPGANTDWPMPGSIEDADTILAVHGNNLPPEVYRLFQLEPKADWSKALWNLEMLLAETGLSREEIFGIVREARCNKYRRDDRSEVMLWREVCKAWARVAERTEVVEGGYVYKQPELLSEVELEAAKEDYTFIEQYVDWAKGVGDAAEGYHQAGAFTILSSLLAGSLQVPVQFANIKPNLWFMLLADTTLTRKSTALELAVDLLQEVEPDVVMATDGSIEGLLNQLSLRPGKTSVFFRDEVSGMIDQMLRRDYLAGMPEALTKLYDGRYMKRVLRKEVIEVKDPVLIMLTGGIRSKVLQLLQPGHVSDGLVPRFIFISAESDKQERRPLGRPSTKNQTGRNALVEVMQTMESRYTGQGEVRVGEITLSVNKVLDVDLTDGAWDLYNTMENKMVDFGLKSSHSELLTPVMDRLAKSGLKAATLIAASRLRERLVVEEIDVYKAFSFVCKWCEYVVEVVGSIGLTVSERQIQTICQRIRRDGDAGVQRSTLMQNYHLSKRDADNIFDTLEQRAQINRVRSGRSERLYPTKGGQ